MNIEEDFAATSKKHKQHKMSWEQEYKGHKDKKREQQFKDARKAGREAKRGN